MNIPKKNVTWAKAHIKKKSDSYKEGQAAAKAGLALNDCPYHGWDNANRQCRLDWCAGFSDAPKKRSKKIETQQDIEQWLRAR